MRPLFLILLPTLSVAPRVVQPTSIIVKETSDEKTRTPKKATTRKDPSETKKQKGENNFKAKKQNVPSPKVSKTTLSSTLKKWALPIGALISLLLAASWSSPTLHNGVVHISPADNIIPNNLPELVPYLDSAFGTSEKARSALRDGSVFLPPNIETDLKNNPGADNGADGMAGEAISALEEDITHLSSSNFKKVPALIAGESSRVKNEAIQEHKNILSTKPATPTPDEATISAFKEDITQEAVGVQAGAGLFLRDLVAVYKSIEESLGKSENKNWDSMYVEIDGELKHFFGEIVVPAIHNCFLGVVSGNSPEEIRFILQTELYELEQVRKSLYDQQLLLTSSHPVSENKLGMEWLDAVIETIRSATAGRDSIFPAPFVYGSSPEEQPQYRVATEAKVPGDDAEAITNLLAFSNEGLNLKLTFRHLQFDYAAKMADWYRKLVGDMRGADMDGDTEACIESIIAILDTLRQSIKETQVSNILNTWRERKPVEDALDDAIVDLNTPRYDVSQSPAHDALLQILDSLKNELWQIRDVDIKQPGVMQARLAKRRDAQFARNTHAFLA